jgi:hypothetical protein
MLRLNYRFRDAPQMRRKASASIRPRTIPISWMAPTREYWEPFYGYYGLSLYWGNGYLYPGFPLSLEQRPVVNEHSSHAQDL